MLVFGGANEFTNRLAEAVDMFSTVYHSGRTKKKRASSRRL